MVSFLPVLHFKIALIIWPVNMFIGFLNWLQAIFEIVRVNHYYFKYYELYLFWNNGICFWKQ